MLPFPLLTVRSRDENEHRYQWDWHYTSILYPLWKYTWLVSSCKLLHVAHNTLDRARILYMLWNHLRNWGGTCKWFINRDMRLRGNLYLPVGHLWDNYYICHCQIYGVFLWISKIRPWGRGMTRLYEFIIWDPFHHYRCLHNKDETVPWPFHLYGWGPGISKGGSLFWNGAPLQILHSSSFHMQCCVMIVWYKGALLYTAAPPS